VGARHAGIRAWPSYAMFAPHHVMCDRGTESVEVHALCAFTPFLGGAPIFDECLCVVFVCVGGCV